MEKETTNKKIGVGIFLFKAEVPATAEVPANRKFRPRPEVPACTAVR